MKPSSQLIKEKSSEINVLLLAAGEGRRLRPITLSTPKCLVPILDRPLMDYWFALLKTGPSVKTCWVNLNYLRATVDSYLDATAPTLPFPIQRLHEKELLGTAGTLRTVIPELTSTSDLLLVHADNLSWFNLNAFYSAHASRPEGCEITMLTFFTDSPQSCGIVAVDSKNIIRGFYEKIADPPTRLANGAVFLLSPKALGEIANLANAFDFSRDVIPQFIGRAQIWHNSEYHRDIGTVSSLQVAQREFCEILSRYTIFKS